MSENKIEELHTKISDIPELSEGDKPLLNSIAVIDKIVRQYASDIINNAFSGEMSKDQFLAWVDKRTTALNRLFLGGFTLDSEDYRRGVWNKPENLGHHVLLKMGVSGNCGEAVKLLLVTFVSDVIKIMYANEEKGSDEAKGALDEACKEIRNKLLGVDGAF